ncbi:MAG: hypothetical protein LQ351_006161 [Letrouitia transgressa]|nr:MAG: hypothetical protein LQ351_006161 [Letrouitia transgressa]
MTPTPSEFPPPSLRPILDQVTTLLKSRTETVSIAETAAGGILSAALLSVPGASAIYKGGLTLYTLESRMQFAGWTEEIKRNYDGPSERVVKGLAENIRGKLGSTYCLSESGTAGPGASGEGRRRQPGYVALAVARERGPTVTREVETGSNDREGNMVSFAEAGLELLRDVIEMGSNTNVGANI